MPSTKQVLVDAIHVREIIGRLIGTLNTGRLATGIFFGFLLGIFSDRLQSLLSRHFALFRFPPAQGVANCRVKVRPQKRFMQDGMDVELGKPPLAQTAARSNHC